MNKAILILLIMIFSQTHNLFAQKRDIIYLSWDSVISRSIENNLSLRSKELDYKIQDLEVWKSLSIFLPSINYSGVMINNVEIPVTIIPPTPPIFPNGARISFGTPYLFQHSLQMTLPLFTGGSRWFNYNLQKNLQKSMLEELKGKEEETVYNTLSSYFGIILSDQLVITSKEAHDVAKSNLEQVEKFFNAGTATPLDLQRAKAQYYSTIPGLEAAKRQYKLANQNLKFLLNIPLEDSIVIADSLVIIDFLKEYKEASMDQFKNIAFENRKDLKMINYNIDAAKQGENLILSQFSPVVALTFGVQHQAQLENSKVSWNDYIRSKSITLSASWSLFEGGKRILDWQQSKIKTDQSLILKDQIESQAKLDVEQNYYLYEESLKSLKSFEETKKQAKESLRLANLLYNEGMSAQLDVLNAQLFYTQSNVSYLEGIYNNLMRQLALLRSIGLLNNIWE